MRKRYKKTKINLNLKVKVNLKKPLFGILIAVFVVSQVLLTILVSSKGGQLAELEREIEEETAKNSELEDRVTRLTSLTTLSSDSQNLGYIRPKDFVYVKAGDTFAKIP